jgi:hypothetical protein
MLPGHFVRLSVAHALLELDQAAAMISHALSYTTPVPSP